MQSAPATQSTAVNIRSNRIAQGTFVASAIVLCGITYNWPLALVNAHLFSVSRGMVISVEALLIVSGLTYALLNWHKSMTRWLLMLVVMLAVFIFNTIWRKEFSPKDIRDVLIIVSFILVGMTLQARGIVRLFLILQAIVLTVTVWELSTPQEYARFTNAKQYFINTRGFEEKNFANANSELFNAYRPQDREILPVLGWLRAASVFMEPVGLGNYCVVATLFLLLFWSHFTKLQKFLLVTSLCVILVASDGRFAALTSMLLIGLYPVLRRIPSLCTILIMPLLVGSSALMANLLDLNRLEDTLPGRIARSIYQLGNLDLKRVMGFGTATPALADSGITYLVVAQSLAGVVILMFFLFLRTGRNISPERLFVLNGSALIFSLGLLVSNSVLSIKTGAFLWLIYGFADRDRLNGITSYGRADQ
jgi:putative polymerase